MHECDDVTTILFIYAPHHVISNNNKNNNSITKYKKIIPQVNLCNIVLMVRLAVVFYGGMVGRGASLS